MLPYFEHVLLGPRGQLLPHCPVFHGLLMTHVCTWASLESDLGRYRQRQKKTQCVCHKRLISAGTDTDRDRHSDRDTEIDTDSDADTDTDTDTEIVCEHVVAISAGTDKRQK